MQSETSRLRCVGCRTSQPALALMAVVGLFVAGADWPHWRGPNRNGIVETASGVRDGKWELSPRPAWRVSVGEGSSSPVVWKEHVYTFGWSDDQERLACRKVDSGEVVWEVSQPAPKYGRHATGDENFYSGPSSTPDIDPQTGLIYTLGIDGTLTCRDLAERGTQVWSLNLYDQFQVPQRPRVNRSGLRDYGYTSSPLVYQDWLIVEVGAKTGTLVAFDKRTGKTAWNSEATHPAGHNGGPTLMQVDGVPCVAVQHFDGLLVARLDPDHAGKTIATVAWRTDFGNNIASVAVHENNVVLTSSYNHHKLARYRISLQGGAEEVWSIDEASKVCTPVITGGKIYWAWQRLYCVDFETGQIHWQGGDFGDPGSVIATADQRLLIWAKNGDLTLAEQFARSPDKFTAVTTRREIGYSEAWPHLVVAENRLFCRDRGGHLSCFELPR